jgi:hypothetical protein
MAGGFGVPCLIPGRDFSYSTLIPGRDIPPQGGGRAGPYLSSKYLCTLYHS